jgi:hypothetical protein
LKETNEFMHKMNEFVMDHEAKFEHELTEPDRLSPEEMVKQGITTKFGVQFLSDGKLKICTKLEVCRLIM